MGQKSHTIKRIILHFFVLLHVLLPHVKRKDLRTTATFLGLIFFVTEPRPQSYKHKTKHYFIFKNGESPFIHFLNFPLLELQVFYF